MITTLGFESSRNSQPLTQINQLALEDLFGGWSDESRDNLDREADTDMCITDREEEARKQT